MGSKNIDKVTDDALLTDIRKIITEARTGVAAAVNAGLTILYWRVGKRIKDDVLVNQRAEYGKEIVVTLSRQLVDEYGNGFTEKNLRRMIQFAEVFPQEAHRQMARAEKLDAAIRENLMGLGYGV